MIVRDWREGEGEVQREEINYHGVHWEDQGLVGSIGVWEDVTALSVCLYVSTLAPGLQTTYCNIQIRAQ